MFYHTERYDIIIPQVFIAQQNKVSRRNLGDR